NRNRRAGTIARTATARRTTAATLHAEADAPGSLTAAANQPGRPPGSKRRRKRGKRAQARKKSMLPTSSATVPTSSSSTTAPPSVLPRNEPSKPTVVAAPERGTKAKRVGVPQPAAQPARGHLDPRLTRIIGILNEVLMAIQEQRDPVPLILGCIMELCNG
ncbi:jg43, partial [Pararge aegeria aegeria]